MTTTGQKPIDIGYTVIVVAVVVVLCSDAQTQMMGDHQGRKGREEEAITRMYVNGG